MYSILRIYNQKNFKEEFFRKILIIFGRNTERTNDGQPDLNLISLEYISIDFSETILNG